MNRMKPSAQKAIGDEKIEGRKFRDENVIEGRKSRDENVTEGSFFSTVAKSMGDLEGRFFC